MTTRGELPTALARPVAQELLASRIPARLAYLGKAGGPRVLPIWFRWTGEAFVIASRADAPKVKAIRRRPDVALTIDGDTPPYRCLQARGTAEIDVVDGIAPEYEEAAHHYYGRRAGDLWLERMRAVTPRMARITIRPTWARLLDVASLMPDLVEALRDET